MVTGASAPAPPRMSLKGKGKGQNASPTSPGGVEAREKEKEKGKEKAPGSEKQADPTRLPGTAESKELDEHQVRSETIATIKYLKYLVCVRGKYAGTYLMKDNICCLDVRG